MGNITLRQVWRFLLQSITTLLVLIAILWGVVKPQAEDLIERTVRVEQFATKQELMELNRRLEVLDDTVGRVDRRQQVLGANLESIQELQREQRGDIKSILRGVHRLQN